jgi:PAS domain S-box-containing protein
MMPGLDGFQLLAAVRGDAQLRTLPVILLSARAGEEARIEGLAAGADDYITKPFSARELSARVASQLQLARVRREAEQAIRQRGEQYGTLLRQAPMGVFLVDAGLRIREINPAALPAFDQPQTALIGSRLEDIVTDQWGETTGRQVVEVFRRTLETGESYVVPEWAHQRADRGVVEYYHWRIDRIPLHDGTFGVVCYFRDISEHVAARETLRHADRQKDEFLATLAHELRNPLAPLRNGLQILKLAQADAAAAARARDMMERQIVQMVRLIDDLLEVSRISHGKISLSRERVELSAIIHRSVETSRPSIDARHHTLELQLPGEPLPLDADPVRLAQVLSNLLNNAAKFTPEGGRIRIDAHRESGAGGEREEIAICVADTGIGMSAELLPRIFEPFLQGDRSLERTSSGLGIGLTLVQRIVELHGGRVEARSAGSGLGSEFIIRLPAARPATATGKPAPALAAEAAPARKRRILVADDNQDAADTLALMLSTSGDEVHTVYDGAAAAEAAFRYRPDIILLDIAMPKLNGYDVAQRIRAELGEGSSPLLIALTGFGAESDRERAQRAGFDAHLVKPVHFDQLAQLFTRLETRPGSTLH